MSKSKSGNWFCGAHHPTKKAKHKAGSARGARKRAANIRKAKASIGIPTIDNNELLVLKVDPNKASILTAMVTQVNFLGNGIKRHELRKHSLIVELMNRIHEYATEEGGEAQNEAKVAEIMASELPDMIKLNQLVTIMGAKAAMEKINIKVISNAYKEETLDGLALLKEGGEGGSSTISTPDSFEVTESNDPSDVPPIDMDAPVIAGMAPAPTPAAPAPSVVVPPSPAPPGTVVASPVPSPAAPTPPPIGHDQASIWNRQATELMGLYRQKVRGNFTPLDKVTDIFLKALQEGVPFEDLRQRVFFPKGDTDQPGMMVKDVKEKMKKAI